MSSYFLKLNLWPTPIEIKFVHQLDIDKVWEPDYLEKLKSRGATPDPLMIFSAPTVLPANIRLDGVNEVCESS